MTTTSCQEKTEAFRASVCCVLPLCSTVKRPRIYHDFIQYGFSPTQCVYVKHGKCSSWCVRVPNTWWLGEYKRTSLFFSRHSVLCTCVWPCGVEERQKRPTYTLYQKRILPLGYLNLCTVQVIAIHENSNKSVRQIGQSLKIRKSSVGLIVKRQALLDHNKVLRKGSFGRKMQTAERDEAMY